MVVFISEGICVVLNKPTMVVDHAVAIKVSLADHVIHFFLAQLLAEVGHHVSKLYGRYHAVVVAVEYPGIWEKCKLMLGLFLKARW